jgi:hypothetical protein
MQELIEHGGFGLGELAVHLQRAADIKIVPVVQQ